MRGLGSLKYNVSSRPGWGNLERYCFEIQTAKKKAGGDSFVSELTSPYPSLAPRKKKKRKKRRERKRFYQEEATWRLTNEGVGNTCKEVEALSYDPVSRTIVAMY